MESYRKAYGIEKAKADEDGTQLSQLATEFMKSFKEIKMKVKQQ